jgi:hypothetical protein
MGLFKNSKLAKPAAKPATPKVAPAVPAQAAAAPPKPEQAKPAQPASKQDQTKAKFLNMIEEVEARTEPMSPEEREVKLSEHTQMCIELSQELAIALQNKLPDIPHYLTMIKKNLNQFPEISYILTDEQIAPVYQALIAYSRVEVTKMKTSKRKPKFDTKLADAL